MSEPKPGDIPYDQCERLVREHEECRRYDEALSGKYLGPIARFFSMNYCELCHWSNLQRHSTYGICRKCHHVQKWVYRVPGAY